MKGGTCLERSYCKPDFLRLILIILFFILLPGLYLTAFSALAHVPEFEGEGKRLAEAIPVENPAKSRVLYGQLESGGTGEMGEEVGNIRYYSFEMEKGERILLSLIVPAPAPEGFVPALGLMGPGITLPETRPELLEIPTGSGAKVLSGRLPEKATYEGFSPSAFYTLASLDLEAPESGTYYAVVLGEAPSTGKGNYGLVLGYLESFSLSEWLLVPAAQIRIYQWEGQSLLQIFLPLALTLLIGGLGLRWGRKKKSSKPSSGTVGRTLGSLAALFFLGTGFSFLFQMLLSLNQTAFTPEVFITLFLSLSHMGIGALALLPALRPEKWRWGALYSGIYFIGLGLAGLFLWAGLYAGPLLAVISALIPERDQ
ncbi:MAG: hypothetical protein PHV51_00880 [Methanosarcinaceae archaeon]|nr:hypothetical protein [Methanosarcinaceae archaeon]